MNLIKALKLILISSLFFIPPHSRAEIFSCPPKKLPKITITKSESEAKLDNTQTVEQISKNKIDTISPYDKSLETEIGGLTISHNFAMPKFELLIQGTTTSDNVCITLKEIKMELRMDQTVLIPSKYKKGSCMYQQVMLHEMKHTKINTAITDEYAPLFYKRLRKAAEKLPVYSVKKQSMDEMNKKIAEYLKNAVETLFNKMQQEKLQKQQNIDSLQEYERVRKACGR